MTLIDRYLFRQIGLPVLGAVAALTAVAMLSQSLNNLEVIVESGQSAWTLTKITLLATPQLVGVILPIGIFVGALLGLNRLHTEQEIVVCYAGGLSRWRVINPAVRLAVLAALLALLISLFLQPWAARQMRQELFSIRHDAASTLVREGEFVQASDDLTVYVARVDQNGLLRDVYIHLDEPGGATVYDAAEGRITERDGRPVLLMNNGSQQEFSGSGVLNFLAFDQYVLDLGPHVQTDEPLNFKDSDRWLHELIFPNLDIPFERHNRLTTLAEGHARIAAPLYSIAFMLLALNAVLGGGFSRRGYGRRITWHAAGAAVVRITGFGVLAACSTNGWLNILQYAVPIGTIIWASRALFRQKIQRYIPLASDRNELVPALT